MTSVSIDRFSGGSLASALFSIEADTDTRFVLNVSTFRELTGDETNFVSSLLAEIGETGITLGKKTTSGFGWFNVSADRELDRMPWPRRPLPKSIETSSAPSKRDTLILQFYDLLRKKNPGLKDPQIGVVINAQLENYKLQPLMDDQISDLKHFVSDLRSAAGASAGTNLLSMSASDSVRLPYRHVHLDTSRIGRPEKIVTERYIAQNLHSVPLPESYSGSIEVSWRFIRPMLVSNGEGTGVKINGTYVLPGASIRGALRSVLEAASNARFSRLSDQPRAKTNESATEFRDRCAQHTRNTSIENAGASPHTNPTKDGRYDPDFVETLFGFVHAPEATTQSGNGHAEHHLKSRLSFGMATLVGESAVLSKEHHITVLGPDTASRIYNQLGWKRYPIDAEVTNSDSRFLDNHLSRYEGINPKDPTSTSFRFLEASPDQPLTFRGEIRFHNITAAELGALLWAITWDNNAARFHKIGYAKPFGAGVCQAADLHLNVFGLEDQAPAKANFNLSGAPIKPFLDAFDAHEEIVKSQGYYETLATATPGIATHLDTYQVWAGYRPHPKNTLADKTEKIAGDNMSPRITAMLRNLES